MIRYKILDIDKGINKFISNSQIIVVVGGFFGDEAKGKNVDLLGKYATCSARVNSGENAGHTMVNNGVKIVTHLVGSGVVLGKDTYISDNCVMDPQTFFNKEIKSLINAGFDTTCLKVGNCNVVMPWHKIVDVMGNPNASTGKGMSQIHQDISGKRAPKIEDFLNNNVHRIKKSFEFWKTHLIGKGSSFENARDILKENSKVPNYIQEFLQLNTDDDRINFVIEKTLDVLNDTNFPKLCNCREEMLKELQNNGKVLLEGPQSFYLANNEGTHPSSSTSAHTTSSGILAASGLPIEKYETKTLAVLKVPSSRVGSGANVCGFVEQDWFSIRDLKKEDLEKLNLDFNHVYSTFLSTIDMKTGISNAQEIIYKDVNENTIEIQNQKLKINEAMAIVNSLKFGEFGATTGKPRVCGAIDLLHLSHVVKYETPDISISCLDRYDGLDKVLVVKEYIYQGEEYRNVEKVYKKGDKITSQDNLPNENILRNCIPVYEILKGWKNSKNLSNEDNLDENISNFINYLEEQTKCRVISFGNGPETSNIIFIEKE